MREPAHGLGEQPRAMARRGRRLPDLGISAPSVVARIFAWARDATDFRPSRNGVGGACASRRMVCESSRERWRDGAGVYRTLGFRPPSGFPRILARARDGTDFRPSMKGVGGACASRRTVGESGRERWRDGAARFPDLEISAPSGFPRILAWARDGTDFRPSINGVGGGCASRRTVCESGRERWRDGAGVYRTLGFRPPSGFPRILARVRDGTDFRPSINGVGGGCASRRTVWESGRERWRDGAARFPDLEISAPSGFPRILAWARDGTDFRPSMIGVGGACASRRTVCESGRKRWRGGAGVYRTSGFRRSHHSTRLTRALTDCNSHLFTLTRLFGRRFGVPRRQDSDACMCARATRHAMQAPDRARPP